MGSASAAQARRKMLADLRRVVRLCTCEWPLTKYRNGDGHHDECPAHVPLTLRADTSASTRQSGRHLDGES